MPVVAINYKINGGIILFRVLSSCVYVAVSNVYSVLLCRVFVITRLQAYTSCVGTSMLNTSMRAPNTHTHPVSEDGTEVDVIMYVQDVYCTA